MINMMSLLLAATLLLPVAALSEDLTPIYAAIKTSKSPHIDGVLDDSCWQTAEKTAPMTLTGGKEIDIKTRGMVCWDSKNLYIAIICPEPLMSELERRIASKSLQPLEEEVEIFIDSDHDHFTHIQFRVDVLGNRESLQDSQLDSGLNTKWSAAVSREADRWTVEMVIPLEVAGAVPDDGALWGFNLNRQRMLDPEQKYLYWSDTKGGFQTPSRFGHLVFADYPTWLRAYYGNKLSLIKADIDKLCKSYPVSATSIVSHINQQEQAYKEFLDAVSAGKIENGAVCAKYIAIGESCVALYHKTIDDLRLLIMENEFT